MCTVRFTLTHVCIRLRARVRAQSRYNTLLQMAETHRAAVDMVVSNGVEAVGKEVRTQREAEHALSCWLDALELADDDHTLQVLRLCFCCVPVC